MCEAGEHKTLLSAVVEIRHWRIRAGRRARIDPSAIVDATKVAMYTDLRVDRAPDMTQDESGNSAPAAVAPLA
jgi:hypothetical protein